MMPSISPMPARMDARHLLRQGAAVEIGGGQQVGRHLDPAQRVADLVGHTRRHLAERGQLLALDEPPLRLHLLGEVAEHAHRAHAAGRARRRCSGQGEVGGKRLPRAASPRHLPAPAAPRPRPRRAMAAGAARRSSAASRSG